MADLVPIRPIRSAPIRREPPREYAPADQFGEPADDSPGLREYFAIVRRHLWLVLGILAASVGVTVYMILTAPPRYQANVVVRLADSRRAMTGSTEAGAYDQVLGRETDLLQSQIQVVTSKGVVSEAVDAGGLRLRPTEHQISAPDLTGVVVSNSVTGDSLRFSFEPNRVVVTGRHGTVSAAYGSALQIDGVTLTVASRPRTASATYEVVSRDETIGSVLDNFRATVRPKTDIIDLQFVANEPHYAQRVANTMALAFQLRNAESAQQQSKRRRIFLEQQMHQTDVMLQQAMGAYSSFRSRQQVFSSRDKAAAQQTGIMAIDVKRADLDAERRTYASLLGQAQRSKEGMDAGLQTLVSSPGIAANPVIQQMYHQLTSYESARDSLQSGGAASTNPDLEAMNTLIASTSDKLISAVRNQMLSLDARIASLDALKARSSTEIATLPATETEEAQLSQQVATIQKMADGLEEDYQKAKMAEAVEAGQVEILDLADAPTTPMAAGRARKLALGILIGIVIGLGAAIFVDGMNTSIHRRDDVEKILQVPGLAVIPRFVSPRSPGSRIKRALPSRNGKGDGNGKHPVPHVSGLVTIADARSSSAEAFRTLRTNLIFSQAVQTLRTLVVTSASPAEGKTTTAANLAVCFAQQGMRVLLVDCDLRRARLHRVFEIAREPGFTELVLGHDTQEAVTHETNVPGLYVVPSGTLPPNPAELLGGDRARQTLQSLTEGYDLLVLDSPPLLAASDAAILATLSDGVLLVVRAGVTEADAGQQAIQQLAAVGARVVGAVLNDPDSKLEQYGGYYRYEYAATET